jgi:hypothetical protein
MKKSILFFLLLPLVCLSQDSTFANSNLEATGNRLHDFKYFDLHLMNLNELRFDIYHTSLQQHIFRASTAGTQHWFLMRVSDGVDRATFQLICDTQHSDSQIELAGTGNTPVHIDTDAYTRLGNQSGLKSNELRFYDAGNSNYTAFKAPHDLSVNSVYTLPSLANNGVLTNNSGVLSWGQATPVTSKTELNLVASFPNSLLPGGTQYFGNLIKPMTTTAGNSKVFFRSVSTITGVEVSSFSQGAGTAEPWTLYVRVNNTVDYLVAVVTSAENLRVFSNQALNIPILPGDYIEMKIVNPIWQTTPTNCTFGGYITILQ